MNEYLIIMGVVGIVAVLSLNMLGGNLQSLFTGTIQSHSSENLKTGVERADQFPGSQDVTAFRNVPGQKFSLKLEDGKALSFWYPNPAAVAETAGGNGVSKNALAILDQVISQLKTQNEDPETLDELAKLSLAGHKIQALQARIESQFPKEGFPSPEAKYDFLVSHNIEVDGKSMTLLEAGWTLAAEPPPSMVSEAATLYPEDYFKLRYNQLGPLTVNGFFSDGASLSGAYEHPSLFWEFMAQLNGVAKAGIFKNPELDQIVRQMLSQQIAYSSLSTLHTRNKAEVSKLVAETQAASNKICRFSDTTLCQQ